MQKKLFTFPFHLVSQLQISPFFAKFYFLYPLKIPGKPKVFCCFQGTLARNGLTHERQCWHHTGSTLFSSQWRCLIKKLFLKISQIYRKTPEFCEIFKNTYFEKHLRTTASVCYMFFVLARFKATLVGYLNGNSDL